MPTGSIRDFSNGVLNQNMLNKDSGAGIPYDAKNVITSFNGELKKRTGTKYLKKLDGATINIPFRDSDNNDIILAFSEYTCDGYKYENNVFTPYLISSGTPPTFPTSDWVSGVSGDFLASLYQTGTITDPDKAFNEPLSERPMKYRTKGALCVYPQSSSQNSFTINIGNGVEDILFNSLNVLYCYSVPGDKSGIWKYWESPVLQYSDDNVSWTTVGSEQVNPYTTGSDPTKYQSSYHYGLGSDEYTENNTRLKINRTQSSDGHKYWRIVLQTRYINTTTFSNERIDFFVQDVVLSNTDVSPLSFETPYGINDLKNIKVAQYSDDLYITCDGYLPKKLTLSTSGYTFIDFNPVVNTGGSLLFTLYGNPTCCVIYANRLGFAGFSAYPNRVCLSAFGVIENFTIPSTILSTSPIVADGLQLKSRIENMFGADKALYLLSQDGVSMIDAPDGGILATNLIEMKLRNREPVASMMPTVKDDIMIYLGRDKRKILITDYDFVVQRFKAQNLSYNFDDLLTSGISELHYISSKQSLIYGTLENGDWFVHLFDANLSKNAIFPFNTNGTIYDITPIKYGDETKLIMVVQRNGFYFIEEKIVQPDQERMDLMANDSARQLYTSKSIMSDYIYLDCATRNILSSPSTIITGLPYNEGDSVEVLADGIYVGTKTVIYDENSDSNALSFDTDVSEVIAGYSYNSYWCLKFASPYVSLKTPKEISAYFINTGYLKLGNSFDDLKPIAGNLVDTVSINSDPMFINGEYTITLAKQIKQTPYVIISSDKGLPFTITGLDYKVDYSNYQGGV